MSYRRPSARPQSRTNPITGEDMTRDYGNAGGGKNRATQYGGGTEQANRNVQSRTGAYSRPMSRPDGVPSLNLGRLVDSDYSYQPLDRGEHRLNTPNSASTVSWGTDLRTDRELEFKQSHRDVIDKSPPKPAHKTSMIDKSKGAIKSVPPQQPSSTVTKPSVKFTPDAPRLGDVEVSSHDIQEDVDVSHLTRHAYSQAQLMKKMDAEELAEENKKIKMLEQVMRDQLSRYVISDPEQDEVPQPPPAYVGRNKVRTLHESKVRTTGTATEHLLSQRVRFGARVLTRSGHDALRDLTGFFFAVDNTLTVYEFKQFGKSAKSMPFIHRGSYQHITGRRKGKPYNLSDIYAGGTLSFQTEGQHSLPETLTSQAIVMVRITDVDEDAKEKVLVPDVRPSEKAAELARMHKLSKYEDYDRRMLLALQAQIRLKLKKRGVKTVTGLGAYFRQIDKTGNGTLDQAELKRALYDYHISIPDEHFEAIWDILDLNGDGVLDYGEFMRGFVGEMNEYRKRLVRKAFQKVDANRAGVVKAGDMGKFYNAAKHPQVQAGSLSENEALKLFLDSWEHCQVKGMVSFVEFEEYYEGLNISIDDDEEFANIMKNSWGL